MAGEEKETILFTELRKNDRAVVDAQGRIIGSTEKYILTVLPKDISTMIRAVAFGQLNEQVALDNKPTQILVDNMPASQRSIERAIRSVKMRFGNTEQMIKAVHEIYNLLQQLTRIQQPPKNSIVARKNFYLWLNGVNLGQCPAALSKLNSPGLLTNESVVRIVGPLVPYGRKLFWNPVGASSKMQFYRVNTKRSPGVRFLPKRGSSVLSPRFKPWAPRTLRRKAGGDPEALKKLLSGATPPGRIENVGQIVKRVMKRNAMYRGLHFTDGWVEYPPAVGWSKLSDPRVPSFGVMFAKKGRLLP